MFLSSWKLSVVLSLLLLVPRAGLAEEAMTPEAEPFQRTELPSSLRLLEAAPEPAPAQDTSRAARGLAVAGGAALFGTVSVATGLQLAKSACAPEDRGGFFGCLGEDALGLLGGVAVGVPLGAWLGGTFVDGRGSYLGALVGTAVGTGVGFTTSVMFSSAIHPQAYLVAFPLFTVMGAVIGYEVSHGWNTPDATVAAPSFQPMLSVTSTGAELALGGRF